MARPSTANPQSIFSFFLMETYLDFWIFVQKDNVTYDMGIMDVFGIQLLFAKTQWSLK